jgi:hypothetical protein
VNGIVTWATARRWLEEVAPWDGSESVEGLIVKMSKLFRSSCDCFLVRLYTIWICLVALIIDI